MIARATLIRLAAVAVGALVMGGVAACTSQPNDDAPKDPTSSAAPLPTGTKGAVDFDAGMIAVGTGTTTVDVYFDPMCPICGAFEKANGTKLAQLTETDAITLRLHPMNFLDRSSQGSKYSSRADAALTCVAAFAPDKTLDYLAALYQDQPKEGSTGRTNATLTSLASGLGVPDITGCLNTGPYQAWAQSVNDAALNGPIPGADIDAVTGTPTVLVNGHEWKLSQAGITDSKDLTAFIAKQ